MSHVSDQLRAVLRQPPERRPPVSVVGEELGGAAILGGALRFGADGPWQQLFPLSLNRAILSAAPAGDKLSPENAARTIGVTPGTLQGYVRSGRVQANPDGTINTDELRRAGFVIRNS